MKTYLRLLTLKACAKAQESLERVVWGGGDGNFWVSVKLKINPVFTKASIASIKQRVMNVNICFIRYKWRFGFEGAISTSSQMVRRH